MFPHAAQQYRIFIADALGEFALGRARAGQYDKAANGINTTLILAPDFPAMKIQHAPVALDSGNLDHAKPLASGVIQDYPNNPKIAADAHSILGRVLLKSNEDTKANQQFEAAVASIQPSKTATSWPSPISISATARAPQRSSPRCSPPSAIPPPSTCTLPGLRPL